MPLLFLRSSVSPLGGNAKEKPSAAQAGGRSLSHFAGALLTLGDLPHK